MPATSLRSRFAKTLAPLKCTFYRLSEGIEIHSQVIETIRVEPLSLPALPVQPYAGPEAINIPAAVSRDWLPALLDRAMPAQYGRVHQMALLKAQSVDLSSILVSDVDYEEIDLPSWLVKPPQAFVAFFDDLFELLGWTDVDGKHYGSRQAQAEEESPKRRRGRARVRPQLRKSYELADEIPPRTKKRIPRYKWHPSFWDIIFPILQPPLDLGSAEPIFLPRRLYPFQQPGVEFLLEHPSALLGDEMGTGKTVMTAIAMRLLFRRAQIRRALVVCPVSVLRVWNHHLMDWAPELSVTVVHGQSKMRRIDWTTPAHVYLTSYDTLRSDIQSGNLPKKMWHKFDLMIADEIQYVKNPTSKRSQALRRLQPPWRWGLSGTPMENKPEDIVSIFRFLKPGLLDDNDNPHVIRRRMASYFLRRRKKDVLPDLPPKVRQERWLDLDPAQRRAYRTVEAQIRGDFVGRRNRGERISHIHIFAAITKLKQICNFAPGKTRSPKTCALGDIVEEIAASGSKVIVFSQYVEEGIGKLERLLEPYGVAKVVGGQSRAVRDAEIDRFGSDPDVHVLLATIRSGGIGLTLTEASYVVHFDHWWNPALKWQAEDRVHRIGQEAKSVNIYEFWMSDTIDDRIYDILERKLLLFEEIVDSLSLSAEEIEQSISDEEWLSIFGVDTGAKPAKAGKRVRETDEQMSLEEILGKLQEMDPFDFERLVGEMFQSSGYFTRVTGKSQDGGIDVVAWKNTRQGPERIAVQCKRYKGNVGVKIARELAGVVASDPKISKGILVTTGGLTPECQRFCDRTPGLEEIAGLQLARYIRNFGIL